MLLLLLVRSIISVWPSFADFINTEIEKKPVKIPVYIFKFTYVLFSAKASSFRLTQMFPCY